MEPAKFPKEAANWEALTKGVSAIRLQSSVMGTWNLAGLASRGASFPVAKQEPEVVIEPEVAVELSIFWLSVEEEVLPSAPNPGGEVYLKMKKNACKGQETEVGTLLEMAVEL